MFQFNVGDIIFYESTTFFGKIIRKVTKSPFTHVAVAVGPDEIVEANAFIKSRRVKFSKENCRGIKVLRLKKPLTDFEKGHLKFRCNEVLGRHYDYKGVIVLLLKILFRIKTEKIPEDITRLWCAELVDHVFEAIGIDLVEGRTNHYVTVTDILVSNKLKVVYREKFE